MVSDELLEEKIISHDSVKIKKVRVIEKEIVQEVKPKKEMVEVKIPSKPSQIFTINSEKENTIKCKEGTRLIIKANSFIDQNNKLVKGPVVLNVTEYYKLSDILLANLSTQSNGKLLETGGMLFLEANKGELGLKLKENSSIEILFPTKSKKENMQLFSGVWKDGNINWTSQRVENSEIEEVDDLVIPEPSVDVPYSVVEQPPVFPGCEDGNTMQQRKCTSNEISKFVNRKFNMQVAEELGLTGRQRINVIFKIDSNGKAIDIQSRASDPDLEIEAERVIALLPKMQPGKQRGKTVSVPYSLPIIFQVDGGNKITANIGSDLRDRKRKLDSFYNKKLEDKLTGKNSKAIIMLEVNGYLLRSSNLGWINCDRFIRRGNKIKYKLKVDSSHGMRVNMIFKSMYSILPSRKTGFFYDFSDVPNNEDVILVAIKNDNGKLYLDLIETTTKENPNLKFNFKELSVSELKKQLKVLDSLFN